MFGRGTIFGGLVMRVVVALVLPGCSALAGPEPTAVEDSGGRAFVGTWALLALWSGLTDGGDPTCTTIATAADGEGVCATACNGPDASCELATGGSEVLGYTRFDTGQGTALYVSYEVLVGILLNAYQFTNEHDQQQAAWVREQVLVWAAAEQQAQHVQTAPAGEEIERLQREATARKRASVVGLLEIALTLGKEGNCDGVRAVRSLLEALEREGSALTKDAFSPPTVLVCYEDGHRFVTAPARTKAGKIARTMDGDSLVLQVVPLPPVEEFSWAVRCEGGAFDRPRSGWEAKGGEAIAMVVDSPRNPSADPSTCTPSLHYDDIEYGPQHGPEGDLARFEILPPEEAVDTYLPGGGAH